MSGRELMMVDGWAIQPGLWLGAVPNTHSPLSFALALSLLTQACFLRTPSHNACRNLQETC